MAETRQAPQTNKLALANLKAEHVLVSSVNPNYQDNHEFGLLMRSIDDDGFTQPIIVQRKTRQIVDGEHRWSAVIALAFLRKHFPPADGAPIGWPDDLVLEIRAKRPEIVKKGAKVTLTTPGYEGTYAGVDPTIAAVLVDFTAEQMKMATLRHNRARGQEDFELLAALLMDLQKMGQEEMAKEALQMSDDEFDGILNSLIGEEMQGDEVAEFIATADTRNATRAVEEQAMQKADNAGAFRVSLLFAGEEATMVKRVLGRDVVGRIIELCREAKAQAA